MEQIDNLLIWKDKVDLIITDKICDLVKTNIKFEEDQELLIELLSAPTFGFVDEDGNPITIDTLPLGDRAIVLENIDDPTFTINKRIVAEEDPKIKKM